MINKFLRAGSKKLVAPNKQLSKTLTTISLTKHEVMVPSTQSKRPTLHSNTHMLRALYSTTNLTTLQPYNLCYCACKSKIRITLQYPSTCQVHDFM